MGWVFTVFYRRAWVVYSGWGSRLVCASIPFSLAGCWLVRSGFPSERNVKGKRYMRKSFDGKLKIIETSSTAYLTQACQHGSTFMVLAEPELKCARAGGWGARGLVRTAVGGMDSCLGARRGSSLCAVVERGFERSGGGTCEVFGHQAWAQQHTVAGQDLSVTRFSHGRGHPRRRRKRFPCLAWFGGRGFSEGRGIVVIQEARGHGTDPAVRSWSDLL